MVQFLEQNDPWASLGQAAGQGLSTGLQMLLNDKLANMKAQKLLSRGFTPQEAQLWEQFTEGGKTHLAKEVVERLQREKSLQKRGFGEEVKEKISAPGMEEEIDVDAELTPKERVARAESRYKTNLPLFNTFQEDQEGKIKEKVALDHLAHLNQSGKLPTGLAKFWQVDWKTGDLRVPAASSEEAQAFVKTVNDFTTEAKKSFGSRITNFELNRFLKRLPTLANSPKGRELIIKQMQIINEINQKYNNEIQNIVDNAGGIRRVDFDRVKSLARKRVQPQIENLAAEYKKIDSSSLQEIKNQSKQKLKKVSKGTPLSDDIIRKLLQQSGQDIDKALELGKKLGYDLGE